MNLVPRSLLARTFLPIAALVLISTIAWLALFRIADMEPRARETAQLASSAVNLIRAALLAAAPENRPALFVELTSREGIRLLPAEPADQVDTLPDNPFLRLLAGKITGQLGTHTRVALAVNGIPGLWVSFRLDEQDPDEYWLILPRERTERQIAWHWLTWALLAAGLALAVAWLIVSHVTRPLRAFAAAAVSIGQGRTPDRLPENGAEELARAAAAFNRMADDLARHERDRAEVLAGISHDLRTPLTRLRLEAELSVNDDTSREAIVADIGQMEAVISQFMDYARGDAGEVPVDTDVDALLASIVARQQSLGRPLGVTLSPVGQIVVRPKALTRAVSNLLDNAWKYGAQPVELVAGVEKEHLVLEVLDRGAGIPPEETERMKRPFTRQEAARSDTTGTGLGLAIVDRVARLHGGTFDLLPREGGGLRASLALPRR